MGKDQPALHALLFCKSELSEREIRLRHRFKPSCIFASALDMKTKIKFRNITNFETNFVMVFLTSLKFVETAIIRRNIIALKIV